MRKSSGMFKFYFVKKKKNNLQQFKFCLSPEDENSTRQTGRETYDFPLARRVSNSHWRVGERQMETTGMILLSLLARIATGNVPENISVDSDVLLQKTKQTEKNDNNNTIANCS